MNKIVAILLVVVWFLQFTACGNSNNVELTNSNEPSETVETTPTKEQECFWTENDFSFYNSAGKEKKFPTAEDYWIHLKDTSDLRTYRDVEIGDRASNLPQIYDLTDFEYSICDYSQINPSTEQTNALETEYMNEGKTVVDILNILPEISSKGFSVYIWCDIYEIDGKLCTKSDIGEISIADIVEHFEHLADVEMDDALIKSYIEMYIYDLEKYSISFSIESEKIRDVSIESHYHNRLQS